MSYTQQVASETHIFFFFFVPSMPPSGFALCLPFGGKLSNTMDLLASFSHEIKRPFVVAFKRRVQRHNQYSAQHKASFSGFSFQAWKPTVSRGEGMDFSVFTTLLPLASCYFSTSSLGIEGSGGRVQLFLSALRIWQSSNGGLSFRAAFGNIAVKDMATR